MNTTRKSKELIHEGKYAAEVEIELEYTDESWSPTMSAADAKKLDTVRLALRRGDIAEGGYMNISQISHCPRHLRYTTI